MMSLVTSRCTLCWCIYKVCTFYQSIECSDVVILI